MKLLLSICIVLLNFEGFAQGDSWKEKLTRAMILHGKLLNQKRLKHINFLMKVREQVFKTVYPLIYEITKTLKDGDRYGENESYKNLSISLQQLESFIFIDVIAKELCENGIIPLTIHDSFIVSKDEAEKAKNIACKVFKTIFGVVPSFSVEAL